MTIVDDNVEFFLTFSDLLLDPYAATSWDFCSKLVLFNASSPIIQETARENDLTIPEIESWQDRYLLAAENSLRSRGLSNKNR
jgi:hypothetical protein